jgi:PKD repeat protein
VTVEADDPPTAGFDYHPSIPTVGTSVTFDASASTDDDEIVRYEWRFGDGTRETTADERVSHTYDDDGSYTVTLTVTDRDGLSHTVERGVTVDPEAVLEPLRADFDFLPVDPLVGEPVQFDAGTSGGPDRTVVRYEWTFGDDAPIVGSVVETHAFTTAGRHLVALNVTDTEGTTATLVRYVTVSPVEPLALTHEPTEPTVDEPVQFAVTGPSPPVGRPVTYEWDFTSDGVVDADGPAVTVSHRYERAGDYTVTLTVVVDDVFLASAESTVSVRDASVVTDVSERVDAEEAAGSPDSDTGSGSSDSTGSDGEADPPAVGDSEPATGDGSDDQVTRFDSPLGLVVVAGLATVGLLAYAAFVVRPSPPPEPVVQDRSARDADDAEDEDDDDRSRPALVVDAYHPQTGDEPLTDEYVRFRNVGETVADLSRATVRNDEGDVYTFPAEYPLEPDATVSLYTGSGTDGEYELYWGATESVWDVDADRIVLRDVLGNPLVAYQYPERGS